MSTPASGAAGGGITTLCPTTAGAPRHSRVTGRRKGRGRHQPVHFAAAAGAAHNGVVVTESDPKLRDSAAGSASVVVYRHRLQPFAWRSVMGPCPPGLLPSRKRGAGEEGNSRNGATDLPVRLWEKHFSCHRCSNGCSVRKRRNRCRRQHSLPAGYLHVIVEFKNPGAAGKKRGASEGSCVHFCKYKRRPKMQFCIFHSIGLSRSTILGGHPQVEAFDFAPKGRGVDAQLGRSGRSVPLIML